ncbi:MAG: hypothetical protein IKN38_04445 [Clostridia bacterium]|nr:hypothetical protein [Clostridia bacterium]
MYVEDYVYGPSEYDTDIATCSFEDDEGLVIFITFKESGGTISVNLSFDQTYPDGRAYGSYSGTKS